MTETYNNRHIQKFIVKNVTIHEDGKHMTLVSEDGWGYGGCPVNELTKLIRVGDELYRETVKFSTVTGLFHPIFNRWMYRKSDQDLEREHQEWRDKWEQEKIDTLEKNRDDWARREATLPAKYRKRLEHFRNVGKDFDKEGWGYELIICELAFVYETNEGVDDELIKKLSREYGTSGNQHDCAKALAKAPTLDGFPAGLAPLMDSNDYS